MGRRDHHRGQERVRGAAKGQREEQGVHLHDHNASVYAAATRRLLKASYPSGHTTNHQIVSLGEDCPFSPLRAPLVFARLRARARECTRVPEAPLDTPSCDDRDSHRPVTSTHVHRNRGAERHALTCTCCMHPLFISLPAEWLFRHQACQLDAVGSGTECFG